MFFERFYLNLFEDTPLAATTTRTKSIRLNSITALTHATITTARASFPRVYSTLEGREVVVGQPRLPRSWSQAPFAVVIQRQDQIVITKNQDQIGKTRLSLISH